MDLAGDASHSSSSHFHSSQIMSLKISRLLGRCALLFFSPLLFLLYAIKALCPAPIQPPSSSPLCPPPTLSLLRYWQIWKKSSPPQILPGVRRGRMRTCLVVIEKNLAQRYERLAVKIYLPLSPPTHAPPPCPCMFHTCKYEITHSLPFWCFSCVIKKTQKRVS